jgi:peptidoglycan hydrolase CwlO-like protein
MVIKRSHLASLSLEQRVSNIEMFARLLGAGLGLSLVGILSFAFWLGSVSARVSDSSETINRVYGAVAENKDSLLVRTSLIEHRLSNVETRLDKVEARLDKVEARLGAMEAKLASMDSKLNNLDSKLNNLDSKLNNLDSKINKLISLQSRTQ